MCLTHVLDLEVKPYISQVSPIHLVPSFGHSDYCRIEIGLHQFKANFKATGQGVFSIDLKSEKVSQHYLGTILN